jgi:hypothetical protein
VSLGQFGWESALIRHTLQEFGSRVHAVLPAAVGYARIFQAWDGDYNDLPISGHGFEGTEETSSHRRLDITPLTAVNRLLCSSLAPSSSDRVMRVAFMLRSPVNLALII